MRLYEGIIGIIYSLSILFFLILFFDYSLKLDWILAIFLLTMSVLIFIPCFKMILYRIRYNSVLKNGIKIKAKVVNIKRSIKGKKGYVRYILKVLYYNPKTSKECFVYINYDQDILKINTFRENSDIDIYINPKHANIALLA